MGNAGATAIVVDDALRRRRRMVEGCAFVGRGIGLIATFAVTMGWTSQGTSAFPHSLVLACYAGVAIMATANVLAWAAFRDPGGPAYQRLSAGQIGLDTALVMAMVVVFAIQYGDRTTWPLLAIPIVTAAIRHRLRAVLIVWAVTSAAYAGVIIALGDRAAHPEDVPFALCMHLLIALVTGTQSSAFARQLADLQSVRAALQHEAAHDALTGLPNRAELTRFADSHDRETLAVLLLDLNGFKPVNDTYGHGVGDDVLRIVGERLTSCLRSGDMAGRLGGDEFLVVLPHTDAAVADHLAAQMRDAIAEPMILQGHTLRVGATIGAAVRPSGAVTGLAALTAEADAAMYRAKPTTTGRAIPVPAER